jgi:hypothetical protein
VQTGDHKAQRGGGVRRASVLIFLEVDKIIRIGVFLTNFFFFFFDKRENFYILWVNVETPNASLIII